MYEVSKSDWKLFREKIGEWQESYMERLVEKYIKFLSSDKAASEKFWELETAQSNSAVVDYFTNIKSLSLEASQSNINRIWNISKNYKQIHCNPWYDGYSVEINY